MNYIIPANPLNLPVYLDQPATRPVSSVAQSSNQFGDASKQSPSTYVYRGEILEALANERRYRPQYNLPAHLLNQRAINTYQNVEQQQHNSGRILDGFI